MAVAVTIDIPGGTEQQYEQITTGLFPDGKLPTAGWCTSPARPLMAGGWSTSCHHKSSSRHSPATSSSPPPSKQETHHHRSRFPGAQADPELNAPQPSKPPCSRRETGGGFDGERSPGARLCRSP
jgi:hypothetical protein